MADKLKMTVEVDKDVITGHLVLGRGLKDGTPSEKVKQWLESHDSVDLKKIILILYLMIMQVHSLLLWVRLQHLQLRMNLKTKRRHNYGRNSSSKAAFN